ncbi:ceramide kinase-like [Saccoglossus kowalevskii]|uniref:Ceramide kinase-like n=1 Tax=Saccoglossus kowalevskii TaxID=10224 RepID=A0ABM0M5Z6_SACKO|nr:PREDICTED: ceramide kinase-like [Saccoglossus kowalevskii]
MDGNNIGSGAISGRFTQDKKKCKHHPLPSMSVWNADGEIIHHPSVDVKVHCQLILLFARGIEDNEEDTRTSCASCSRKCY